jgi:hypothetical protein
MNPKIRLELSALSVASFTVEGGGQDPYGPASMETQDASCEHYCGPDNQNSGPTVPGEGC